MSADGQSIVVTYSEALSGTPEAKDYAVSASSGAVSITQATLGTGADNNKVILALSDTVLGNVTLSNLAYSAESGTFYSIKDAAAEPNASAPQTLASVANGSAVAATFTVTETGGAVTFSGTVKGDISVSWSGILGASVATFTRGDDAGFSGFSHENHYRHRSDAGRQRSRYPGRPHRWTWQCCGNGTGCQTRREPEPDHEHRNANGDGRK